MANLPIDGGTPSERLLDRLIDDLRSVANVYHGEKKTAAQGLIQRVSIYGLPAEDDAEGLRRIRASIVKSRDHWNKSKPPKMSASGALLRCREVKLCDQEEIILNERLKVVKK